MSGNGAKLATSCHFQRPLFAARSFNAAGGAKVLEASLNGFPSKDIADQIEIDPSRFLICADKSHAAMKPAQALKPPQFNFPMKNSLGSFLAHETAPVAWSRVQ
jgi:hypothetical protein